MTQVNLENFSSVKYCRWQHCRPIPPMNYHTPHLHAPTSIVYEWGDDGFSSAFTAPATRVQECSDRADAVPQADVIALNPTRVDSMNLVDQLVIFSQLNIFCYTETRINKHFLSRH